MDNYFNFRDTANTGPSNRREQSTRTNQEVGTLDANLMPADFPNDETSFLSLQHFVDGLTSSSNSPEYMQAANTPERGGGRTGDDFNDFSRWVDGAKLPARPCDYCQAKGLQCLVIQRNASQTMSCTSCHALSQSCSLGQDQRLFNPADATGTFDNSSRVTSMPGRSVPALRSPLPYNETAGSQEGDSSTSKVGARFSREAVRVLKQWLNAHYQHPYPTDDEKEQLKRQTGLNKTQITNWLANARRRGKVRAPGTKSPGSGSQAIDIPTRGTPVSEHMPLERWKNSPPESEPATVSAIATAVRTTSVRSDGDSPYSYAHTDETNSLARASSASSVDTSQSSGHSFASAFSHQSGNLRGTFGTFGKRGRRRRRRQAVRPTDSNSNLGPRQFQCTFCTESFRTKHDWQRHEKSLHLSLERWVCSATGGTCLCKEKRQICCVFCGQPRPNAAHLETHNYSSCLERELEERTFYRKDHLRQHLRLVHGCKFNAWSMDPWRATIPEIKSTCGFCGTRMTTWQKRADHLAEHFKAGQTMAEWRGDWGFEKHILDLIESATPPSMIHLQRANRTSPVTQPNPISQNPSSYELVKIGLIEYIHARAALGHVPSNTELQYEGIRLVFGTPSSPKSPSEIRQSWFHDLILFSDNATWLEPFRTFIGGRQPLGDQDELEMQLLEYVRAQQTIGINPSTADLQAEACQIITSMEAEASIPSEAAASWFRHLAKASNTWLNKFKARAGLSLQAESNNSIYNMAPNTASNIYNPNALEAQLGAYVNLQASLGVLPTDSELQTQARWILFGTNNPSNQTAADNDDWLRRFKNHHGIATTAPIYSPNDWSVAAGYPTTTRGLSTSLQTSTWQRQPAAFNTVGGSTSSTSNMGITNPFLHSISESSANFAQTAPSYSSQGQQIQANNNLEQALSDYIQTSISPTNPSRHIPSDNDIRNQARWILFGNSTDLYNNRLTPADNPEWLIRLKRSVGLSSDQATATPTITRTSSNRSIGARGFPTTNSVFPSNQALRPGQGQLGYPAQVFSAPELEAALNEYVKNSLAQGFKPTNEELRRVGKMVMGEERTAVDDAGLLGLFRAGWGIGDGE